MSLQVSQSWPSADMLQYDEEAEGNTGEKLVLSPRYSIAQKAIDGFLPYDWL
jgi:hypothetical protein